MNRGNHGRTLDIQYRIYLPVNTIIKNKVEYAITGQVVFQCPVMRDRFCLAIMSLSKVELRRLGSRQAAKEFVEV
jgi:hypothetical protein